MRRPEYIPGAQKAGRIDALDLWRSLAILAMVAYHFLWDITQLGVLERETLASAPAEALRYFSAASFIIVSGAASCFSRDNLRRGFYIFCAGLLVSLVTAALGMAVAFGILQFLGIMTMLCHFARPWLERLRVPWTPLLWAALWALSQAVTRSVTVGARWLYPLGLRYEGFGSVDYYPLLPWAFAYFIGVWLGGELSRRRGCPLLTKRLPAALTAPGRYSLIIYLLHQPVLLAVCWAVF
ncbi:MAG: DUF1624 domain-containing protein [Oscillospiraceae bacterium]|nr:DUF1624 domain-containing protein [Oscillospiraceae bacterium]